MTVFVYERHPISYGSADIDAIIRFINIQYETTFIGRLPSEKFTVTIKPQDRAEKILALPSIGIYHIVVSALFLLLPFLISFL